MIPHLIAYDYELPDGSVWSFEVDLNRKPPPGCFPEPGPAAPPPWTRLAFHRCDNCPLAATQPYCPPAVDTAPILDRFSHVPSTARVKVTMRNEQRMCIKETDAQMGLEAMQAMG